jgi:hypothetical protein
VSKKARLEVDSR